MSLDLGHSGSYINSITSGRTFPSLREFLYICEYLDIMPEEFFQPENDLSPVKRKAIAQVRERSDEAVALLTDLIDKLKEDR